MHSELIQKAEHYFQNHIGVSLEELLLPISSEQPAGKSVRDNSVYSAIREARREDDPTLPMGTWTHELKQADWARVTDIAVHALVSKTKDLQVAAWLMEAQINSAGFEAVSSCMLLISALCERYWETLYPRIEEGDQEYRANIIRWINEKLLPQIRLLPITESGRSAREHCWADFEQAKRNEKLRAMRRSHGPTEIEGATLQDFQAGMSATSTESHAVRYHLLSDALETIEGFTRTLDQLWGTEAPSLSSLAGLLEQIQALIAAELYKRGVRLTAPRGGIDKNAAQPGETNKGNTGDGGDAGDSGGGGSGGGPIRSRAAAYQQLAAIADYLATLEPHSPVPYLVKRAVEWGNMNTAELFHELFLKFNAQLSIFEILGIEVEKSTA